MARVVTTHINKQAMKHPYMVININTNQITHRFVWLTDMDAILRNIELRKQGSPLRYEPEPKVISAAVEKPIKEEYCFW